MIDGPIGRVAIPLVEITGPASQCCIEAIPHFRPWHHIPRLHQAFHFSPESGHALLRRTHSEIHRAIPAKAMRPERIPQKVKPLSVSLPYVGFRFVQSYSDPAHHPTRPIQRLARLAAAENHEIVSVVHYLSLKQFAPPGDPPVLQ